MRPLKSSELDHNFSGVLCRGDWGPMRQPYTSMLVSHFVYRIDQQITSVTEKRVFHYLQYFLNILNKICFDFMLNILQTMYSVHVSVVYGYFIYAS